MLIIHVFGIISVIFLDIMTLDLGEVTHYVDLCRFFSRYIIVFRFICVDIVLTSIETVVFKLPCIYILAESDAYNTSIYIYIYA